MSNLWIVAIVAAVTWPSYAQCQNRPEFTLREIWRFGEVDPIPGQELAGPFISISVAPDGTVAVLDQTLVSVTILKGSDGTFLRRVGRAGRGPGELGGPVAIAWDPAGDLWIVDQRNRRYNRYDSTGGWVASVPRPSGSANRRVFPIRILWNRELMDHDGGAGRVRVFTVDSLGNIQSEVYLSQPDRPQLGIIRQDSAIRDVIHLLPALRWTFSGSGRSVWLARSDSLRLLEVNLEGDTLRVVRAEHRSAEFSKEQIVAVRRANRQLGRDGGFKPPLVQALHALRDGRVLVQIGGDGTESGQEFDMFSAEGHLLGTIHAPFRIHHRSVLDSRGDTLFVHTLGAFDTPVIVKAVIQAR